MGGAGDTGDVVALTGVRGAAGGGEGRAGAGSMGCPESGPENGAECMIGGVIDDGGDAGADVAA